VYTTVKFQDEDIQFAHPALVKSGTLHGFKKLPLAISANFHPYYFSISYLTIINYL